MTLSEFRPGLFLHVRDALRAFGAGAAVAACCLLLAGGAWGADTQEAKDAKDGGEKAAAKADDAKKTDPGPRTFLGVEIEGEPGVYLVTADVNVRAKPGTAAAKVGRFDEGTRVKGMGNHQAWLAVLGEDGKEFGFIYAPITIPLIDGTLADDIRKRARTADGVECDYNVHFEGKTPVEGMVFETADYEVWFRCFPHGGAQGGDNAKDKIIFPTVMFMTEGPFQGKRKGDHQITLDVPQIGGEEYEETLSVTLLYDRDEKTVRFDRASLDKLTEKPKVASRKADTLPAVLAAAVEIALSTWDRKTLDVVAKAEKR